MNDEAELRTEAPERRSQERSRTAMSKLDRPTSHRVDHTPSPAILGDPVKRSLVILTAALGLFATVIAPLTRAAHTVGQFLVQCGGPVRSAVDHHSGSGPSTR